MGSQNTQRSHLRQANPSQGAIECIICMEVLVNPRMLPCGHSFCSSPKKCLVNLLKMKSPPRCASCNGKLRATLKEKDVPRNYALSSAIEDILRPSANQPRAACPTCPKHGKEQEFYCRPCELLICSSCWQVDHNTSKHEVVFFSATLEPFEEMQSKLNNCKMEANILLEKCSEVLDQIENAESSMKHVMCSTTPAEVNEHVEAVRSRLSTSSLKLRMLSTNSIVKQIDELRSKLAETSNVPSCSQSNLSVEQGPAMDTLDSSKFNTIAIDLDETSPVYHAAIDTAQVNLYLASSRKIKMFKIVGGEAIFEEETDEDLYLDRICVVNEQLVLVKLDEKELEIRDKFLVRNRKVALVLDGRILRISGYSETLALLCGNNGKVSVCLYRGVDFNFVAQTDVDDFENDRGLVFCNDETLIVASEYRLCVLNFNEHQITAKRYITLDGISDGLISLTFLTNPALSPHKGYVVGFNEVGMFYWKFPERSLKEGDTISATALLNVGESTNGIFPLPRSSKIITWSLERPVHTILSLL